ncbi:hypothetical protein TDB9533_02440 [Thalassocella blandensis]|nr:hypothetical protein TDB9533_02440 [Thalassocella blandensis]
MKRILIFGNSGSGKSTLARHLATTYDIAHLDLDTLAWLPTSPPQRMPIEDSSKNIMTFIEQNPQWVVEGCYTDLLKLLDSHANEIIFMDLSISLCVENAKRRPWEPHKYASKAAQDKNLSFLIEWIKQYRTRVDTFSYKSHEEFYNTFIGEKVRYTQNTSIT